MISLLRSRRSIRKYQSKRLDPQIIELFKEAVLRSPSSRGNNPWEFIFVTDPELLASLAKSKGHSSSFVENAALAIIVCGNERKSDVWIEDCSIASIIIQLTAHSIGLGSCWVQIRNRNHNADVTSETFIQKQLNIPEHIKVDSIIAIGFPDENPEPVSSGSLEYGKIHINSF